MPMVQAQEFKLPVPGVMVRLSPPLNPPILKGIKVYPNNPFRFDFILDVGDGSKPSLNRRVMNPPLQEESTRLIKYFLASLTIPEKDLWVNLSPYEKHRIIPQSFGLTEMGRDLLAEDYMLKQITASLIYPEGETGKKFWKRIYAEAAKKFGTTNIPVNTFNKVWIVPEKAVVYENAKAGTAYVVESKLKVMLEQDYLALYKNNVGVGSKPTQERAGYEPAPTDINQLGFTIVRQIIIPELTKEVNEGKNFAQLRQVYNSLILATWYKKKIKDSILAQVYSDKSKTAGVQYMSTVIPAKAGIHFKNDVEGLYQEYLKAFKKGVYNYIKEEVDPATQETIPRKYFSGGVQLTLDHTDLNAASTLTRINTMSKAMIASINSTSDFVVSANAEPLDRAMALPNLGKLLRRMITSSIPETPQEHKESAMPEPFNSHQPGGSDSFTPDELKGTGALAKAILYNFNGDFNKRMYFVQTTSPDALLRNLEAIGFPISAPSHSTDLENIKTWPMKGNVGHRKDYEYIPVIITVPEHLNEQNLVDIFANLGNTCRYFFETTRSNLILIVKRESDLNTFKVARDKEPLFRISIGLEQILSQEDIEEKQDEAQVTRRNLLALAVAGAVSVSCATPNLMDQETIPSPSKLDSDMQQRQDEMQTRGYVSITSPSAILAPIKDYLNVNAYKSPELRKALALINTFEAQGNIPPIFKLQDLFEDAGEKQLVRALDQVTGFYALRDIEPKSGSPSSIFLHGVIDNTGPFETFEGYIHARNFREQNNTLIAVYNFRDPINELQQRLYPMIENIRPTFIYDHSFGADVLRELTFQHPQSDIWQNVKGVYEMAPLIGGSNKAPGNFFTNNLTKGFTRLFNTKNKDMIAEVTPVGELQTKLVGFSSSFYNIFSGKVFQVFGEHDEHIDWKSLKAKGLLVPVSNYYIVPNVEHGKIPSHPLARQFMEDKRNAIETKSPAQTSNTGGIDLTAANKYLQTQNSGGTIKFHIDPAMLKELQDAPGFSPVIISIQPLNDVPQFLGIV